MTLADLSPAQPEDNGSTAPEAQDAFQRSSPASSSAVPTGPAQPSRPQVQLSLAGAPTLAFETSAGPPPSWHTLLPALTAPYREPTGYLCNP